MFCVEFKNGSFTVVTATVHPHGFYAGIRLASTSGARRSIDLNRSSNPSRRCQANRNLGCSVRQIKSFPVGQASNGNGERQSHLE